MILSHLKVQKICYEFKKRKE